MNFNYPLKNEMIRRNEGKSNLQQANWWFWDAKQKECKACQQVRHVSKLVKEEIIRVMDMRVIFNYKRITVFVTTYGVERLAFSDHIDLLARLSSVTNTTGAIVFTSEDG
ncbi:hypothetical protein PIB30_055964 [Stylosanthes scabra]|uniref:Uncharacterized protein n=1 Tax=Stylosanthes scabra TaxID=79078 RepID=A0ABU6SJ21_9FABA|nr:hypothetical protein [Stylosanthes scabra]